MTFNLQRAPASTLAEIIADAPIIPARIRAPDGSVTDVHLDPSNGTVTPDGPWTLSTELGRLWVPQMDDNVNASHMQLPHGVQATRLATGGWSYTATNVAAEQALRRITQSEREPMNAIIEEIDGHRRKVYIPDFPTWFTCDECDAEHVAARLTAGFNSLKLERGDVAEQDHLSMLTERGYQGDAVNNASLYMNICLDLAPNHAIYSVANTYTLVRVDCQPATFISNITSTNYDHAACILWLTVKGFIDA